MVSISRERVARSVSEMGSLLMLRVFTIRARVRCVMVIVVLDDASDV